MRLVIVGGGGFRVPLLYRALTVTPSGGGLIRPGDTGVVDEVVLHDTDAGRTAAIVAVLQDLFGSAGPRVRVSTSLPDALTGADFVFSAFRVSGAQGRIRDELRARRLGLLGQETVGAGGLAFGLRSVPVALELAAQILEHAPTAWLVNFTNPAGMVTEAVSQVLGHRVIGICDSPVGLIRRAGQAVGLTPAQIRDEAQADYVGINHLGWLRSLTHGGVDLLTGLLRDERRLATFEEGRLFGPRLLAQLGCIPNEYLHFLYAHRDLAAVPGDTRGQVVAAQQDGFYAAAAADPQSAAGAWERTRRAREETYLAETRQPDEARDEADLAGGGYEEVAVAAMAALAGREPRVLIVNVRNGSTVPALPADVVVEVPSLLTADGARPLPLPGSPPTLHQVGLMATVRAAEREVIAAVRNRSVEHAVHAFTIHPLISSPALAADLVADLLSTEPATAALLR